VVQEPRLASELEEVLDARASGRSRPAARKSDHRRGGPPALAEVDVALNSAAERIPRVRFTTLGWAREKRWRHIRRSVN
jgi:hypothetical protein